MNLTGRYAPSPTGPLHLGNLRTALLAWLFARSAGASFVLRVDDLDASRSRPRHETGQLADLAAIGIDWDGPIVRQSERHDRYEQAIEQLERSALLYPCFCTRADIRQASSAPHGATPGGDYPGTCRRLTPDQRRAAHRNDRPPAWRLRAHHAEMSFDDRLLGPQHAKVDDFVVRRNDGTPSYNLAVVVDDFEQGIGEVVRGADLVETTSRQLLLARILSLPEPSYAHVPLVLGDNGRRLSKREGAVTLADRLALGETPEQVRGMLLRSVGLPEDLEEALSVFEPAALPTEPTAYSELTGASA